MTPRLLTTAEVAEMLQVTPRTVRRWVRGGRLPGRKLSPRVLRFRQEDVDEFVNNRPASEPSGG